MTDGNKDSQGQHPQCRMMTHDGPFCELEAGHPGAHTHSCTVDYKPGLTGQIHLNSEEQRVLDDALRKSVDVLDMPSKEKILEEKLLALKEAAEPFAEESYLIALVAELHAAGTCGDNCKACNLKRVLSEISD